jgi:hypothetical protein
MAPLWAAATDVGFNQSINEFGGKVRAQKGCESKKPDNDFSYDCIKVNTLEEGEMRSQTSVPYSIDITHYRALLQNDSAIDGE